MSASNPDLALTAVLLAIPISFRMSVCLLKVESTVKQKNIFFLVAEQGVRMTGKVSQGIWQQK